LSFRKTLTIKKGEIIVRVFVTGATGFIGSHVVKELLAAGHEVLGLARSDASTQALNAVGANVQRGSLEDIKSLKSGTTASEAVIHLGMSHDLSDLLKVFEDLVKESATDIRGCLDHGAHCVQIDFTEGRLAVKLDPSGKLLSPNSKSEGLFI
jgi:NAD(P)-dependent dehydrogenase (short-subunit alcohol dehydrogenase family)